MAIYNKASERVLGGQTLVDVDAASPQMKRFRIDLPLPALTQNASTFAYSIATTSTGFKIVGGYIGYGGVVPAQSGGTATYQIDRYNVAGDAATIVVAATTILTGIVTKVNNALTLAGTNPTSITAGQSILVTLTASNHTVGAPGTGGQVTLLCEKIADPVISF